MALTPIKGAFETDQGEVPSGDQGQTQEELVCETSERNVLFSPGLAGQTPALFSQTIFPEVRLPGFAQGLEGSASLPAASLSPAPGPVQASASPGFRQAH